MQKGGRVVEARTELGLKEGGRGTKVSPRRCVVANGNVASALNALRKKGFHTDAEATVKLGFAPDETKL